MRTHTRKHLSVVGGLSKFAQVTVGQEELNGENPSPSPLFILNDRPLTMLTRKESEVIEAAKRGVHETKSALGWQGAKHFVLKIEGLEVDGIDPQAAFLAAGHATRALIEE